MLACSSFFRLSKSVNNEMILASGSGSANSESLSDEDEANADLLTERDNISPIGNLAKLG